MRINESTIRVSVCMATFNGEEFVQRQVESILCNLGADDELIVYDDASTDSTLAVLGGVRDDRIHVSSGKVNVGHVRAFESAISMSRGKYVLLADQDDVWVRGRVDQFISALAVRPVAASSVRLVDVEGREVGFLSLSGSAMAWRDVLGLLAGRRPYYGCAMGFDAELKELLLPFPRIVEAHDHWIAICGLLNGGVEAILGPTVLRTLHERNLSPRRRRGFFKVLRTRVILLVLLAFGSQRRQRLPD